MINNKIQALYKLQKFEQDLEIGKLESLVPQYLKSGIEIFSHQIYAATIALSNPFVKGFILADEAGLGKSMEALLIVSQYHKQNSKILIVVPTPTIENWLINIIRVFNYKCCILETNERHISENYTQDLERYENGIVLTTYDYIISNPDKFKKIEFELCVLDEAHRFRSFKIKDNKTAEIIQSIVPKAKKILLTATPIQKNEDDIFGLINFIDDTVFTDYDEFHKKYFRKPENYPELRDLIAPYTFRTLRSQVKAETKLTERQILTQIYKMTEDEKILYSLIEKYVAKSEKFAFPDMQPYELSLMLYDTLSSSAYAISKTLSGIYTRLNKHATNENEKERQEIKDMLDIATRITYNHKDELLIKALNQTFSTFHKKGIAKKCVIFTGNTQTQDHIHKFLMIYTDYSINSFNGTTDNSPIEKFLKSDKPSILISTDKGNESLNWQEASFIINYDFPQVLLDMEQRISRCHRIGQASDVFVLNFICPENFYDVRMYELFYKRMNVSNSIIGASDTIISGAIDGDINENIKDTLENIRKKKEVQIDFAEICEEFKEELAKIETQRNQILFNSFDKAIVEKTKNWGQIVRQKVKELDSLIKELARFYYKDSFISENVFEYKTSWHRKNPYARPAKCTLGDEEDCHKFTLGCEACKEMLSQLDILSLSNIIVGKTKNYLKLILDGKGKYKGFCGVICDFKLDAFKVFLCSKTRYYCIGFDKDNNMLPNEICDEILSMECLEVINIEEDKGLEKEIEEKLQPYLDKIIDEMSVEIDKNTELPISHIRMQAENEKNKLVKEIYDVQKQINSIKNSISDNSFGEQLAKNQQVNELSEKLFELKDNEFLKKSKINRETKQKIEEFLNNNKLSFTKSMKFMVYFEVR